MLDRTTKLDNRWQACFASNLRVLRPSYTNVMNTVETSVPQFGHIHPLSPCDRCSLWFVPESFVVVFLLQNGDDGPCLLQNDRWFWYFFIYIISTVIFFLKIAN